MTIEQLRHQIAALEAAGAVKNSMAGHFIESLCQRAAAVGAPLSLVLLDKAAVALEKYRAANEPISNSGPSSETASSALAKLLTDIDCRRYQAASAARNWVDHSAGGNSKDLDASEPGKQELGAANAFDASPIGELQELTSVRLFRESLVKLSSDKLVSRIIKEAPENPGPLNPQMLVIRSLSTMRDLSPDYLNRFVAYVDTLQWLEQATLVKKSSNSRSVSNKKNSV